MAQNVVNAVMNAAGEESSTASFVDEMGFHSENEGQTQVLDRPDTQEKPDLDNNDGDADRFAHYVSRAQMQKSAGTGRPVIALCGKVWVPTRKPDGYPICPECKKIYAQLMGGSQQ